jgi:hypothetical protein
MGKKTQTQHSVKTTIEFEKQIDAYCARHNIQDRASFYRFAASQLLKPDVEDPELVFSSLKHLHDTLHKISRQQEILFSFTGFFFRNLLAYHPEIPNEVKDAAVKSAYDRYERAFKSYQDNLKNTPAMFESLLADYFEEA